MSPWLALLDGHVVPAGTQLPGQLALWPPHTGRDDCPAWPPAHPRPDGDTMTIRTLSYPAQLSESLRWQRPDHPHVRVTPKDAAEHTCAVYAADHYEVGVFYAAATVGLEALEAAVAAVPRVYRTTRVLDGVIADPTWPGRYRGGGSLRNQVLAFMCDVEPTP